MNDNLPTSSPKTATCRAGRAASLGCNGGRVLRKLHHALGLVHQRRRRKRRTRRRVRCIESSEGSDAAVTDCMRPGRHIRVDTSISRGTASLRERVDGFVPAASRGDAVGVDRHLHVRDVPGAWRFRIDGLLRSLNPDRRARRRSNQPGFFQQRLDASLPRSGELIEADLRKRATAVGNRVEGCEKDRLVLAVFILQSAPGEATTCDGERVRARPHADRACPRTP